MQLTLHPSQGFQAIIHITIFTVIISEFEACLSQTNMAQEQL